jgi:hypothetical protein
MNRFGSTRFRQARLGTRTWSILFKPGGVQLLEAAVVANGLQPSIDKSRKGGVDIASPARQKDIPRAAEFGAGLVERPAVPDWISPGRDLG